MKIKENKFRILIITTLFVVLASTAETGYTQVSKETTLVSKLDASFGYAAKITVHLYSGIEDPVFYLNDIEAETLVDLIDANTLASKTVFKEVLPARLGYKGISVERLKDDCGLPKLLQLYSRKLLLQTASVKTSKIDIEAAVEAHLKNKAKAKGITFPGTTSTSLDFTK